MATNGNGKKKNGKLTKGQLVAAAVELNKEIMPHPPINVATEDVGLLKGQIMEAAGIIVPDDDEITPETQHVIDTLEAQDMVPTIEGKPQQAAEPATEPTSTEPKEEDKTEDKEELVKLIKTAERIKDLKGIVESNPTFKALRKKMAEGLYRVQDGLTLLKREMLEAMGYEQKDGKKSNGNGKGKTKPIASTKSKVTTKPKATVEITTFGSREGTQAAIIDQALLSLDNPVDLDAVVKKTGLTKARIGLHINHLINKKEIKLQVKDGKCTIPDKYRDK